MQIINKKIESVIQALKQKSCTISELVDVADVSVQTIQVYLTHYLKKAGFVIIKTVDENKKEYYQIKEQLKDV